MKTILKIISLIGLILTLVPALLVFYGVIDKSTDFMLMTIGVVLWFASAPFWMKNPSLDS
ncbi:MAG: hypothetical protein RIA69_17945 [Cyclobacteriaceae bacterium]